MCTIDIYISTSLVKHGRATAFSLTVRLKKNKKICVPQGETLAIIYVFVCFVHQTYLHSVKYTYILSLHFFFSLFIHLVTTVMSLTK